jgi:hypothetical protein
MDEESREALRNLVLLVASLTFCGHQELKMPCSSIGSGTLYQLDSFEQPEPINRGSSMSFYADFIPIYLNFIQIYPDLS